MLKKRSQFFLTGLFFLDLVLVLLCWIGSVHAVHAWDARKVTMVPGGYQSPYVMVMPLVALVTAISFWYSGLYRARRTGMLLVELGDLVRAVAFVVVVLVVFPFFLPRDSAAQINPEHDNIREISRWVMVAFALSSIVVVATARVLVRKILWELREHGRNLRYVLVVGAGKLGQQVVERIHRNPWTGFSVVGYVDDNPDRQGKMFFDVPVVGTTADLSSVIRENNVDQVFVALPFNEVQKLKPITDMLATEMVELRVVPDLTGLVSLNTQIGDFDGLPVVSIRESPLYGWNCVVKRGFDVVGSVAALAILAIPMMVIAILVKRTGKGPVFYRQERMGLDGRTFEMLKFRTMRVGAESQTGAVWAKRDDPRRTRIGAFLRRTSLDEIPQFLNTLAGHMSIVGPRPERPVFIEEFKKSVPRYMLRHKMKAGITGWAQVNGWRGNTSLEKRIQYDLYYIENWSLWLDIRIMFLTIFSRKTYQDAY